MDQIAWIGAEIDGQNLRAWAGSAEGTALAQTSGRWVLSDGPLAALNAMIAPWRRDHAVPVLVAGLAGAATTALPCAPIAVAPTPVAASGPEIWLVRDLTQTKPVDRVGAAQALCLAGCLRGRPQFDGVVCLTGPHSLWAHISAGEVVSVTSAASGVLADALVPALPASALERPEGFAVAAFDAALSDCLSRPERMARLLSAARLMPSDQARATVRGALIGAELAATRPWWLGQTVLVLGTGAVPGLYARALAAQGVQATAGLGDVALLAGFGAAAKALAA